MSVAALALNPVCGSGGGLGGVGLGGVAGATCAAQTGVGGLASTAASVGLWGFSTLFLGGAGDVLHDTATVLGHSTAPQLGTTWFSSTYWRMAAVATVLTLPFLFAAAVQALIRSDLALLIRAALGYLPLAMLSIAVAAPLTMLVLAATDQLCAFVAAAAGHDSNRFLAAASLDIGALSALTGSPALVLVIGLFVMAAAFVVWIELLMRAAAVYVIVLMLPLAFAALVWPARRVWAVRVVELLVALILSKFAIVAVLSLGGAALESSAGSGSVTTVMAGAVLLVLAAFSPWALLRLIPLAELAGGAAPWFRGERLLDEAQRMARGHAARADDWARRTTAAMKDDGAAEPDRYDPPSGQPGDSGSASSAGTPAPEAPPSPTGTGAGSPEDPSGSPAGDSSGSSAGEWSAPRDPPGPVATDNGGAAATSDEGPIPAGPAVNPDDGATGTGPAPAPAGDADDFASQEALELGPGLLDAHIRLPGDPE
jgi:hypothetical protein